MSESGVLGEARCRQISDQVFAAARADQVEIMLSASESALTRFANSTIHQNVHELNAELKVRVVLGKRVGAASTNDLSNASIADVTSRATAIAERQREDEHFAGLPQPASISPVESYDSDTADLSPEARASAVKIICDLAVESNLVASGAFSTSDDELTIASSLGVWAHGRSTRANFKTVIMGQDDAAGWAERTAFRAGLIDFEALGREAADKASRGRSPLTVESGEYTVLLEEYAVGEALNYLSYMGFGALSLQEGRSFLTDRLGAQVMSEQISIWDDGADTRGLPSAFDFEGVPKQKVSLIERGVARGVVYDTRTAARAGVGSTGHALPAPNTFGPLAWNLVMAPGDSNKQEMIAGIERGIWVTRFHYVNILHPRHSVLTGMTRDGTFLIENGQVSRPIRNMRFTQNMLEALSGVRAAGSELIPVEGFFGATLAPALLLDSFTFTGVSTPGS